MALEIPDMASSNPNLQKAMNKIVKAENKSLEKFDQKSIKVENQLKIVKDLKSKIIELKDSLTPFKSPNDFRDLKGESANPEILDVTSIDKTKAKPGTYDFEVLGLASTNSIMTTGMRDRDRAEVGVGYVSFKTPEGEERDVYINSENNTLDGMARAINNANVGVTAHVVHDGTDADEPWRLVISGNKTGWKEDFEWPTFYFLDGDLDLDKYRERDAQSAIIKFNGMPMYADENKIKELLPGITMDLKKAVPGQSIRVEVKPDIQKIEEKAKNFVDKMNALLGIINSQGQVDQSSRNDPTKALSGDVTLLGLKSRLTSMIQNTATDLSDQEVKALRDVGVVFNRSGTLDFDSKKFQSQLETNFEQVSTLFAGTSPLSGFANNMIRLTDGFARRGDGIISLRETNLQGAKDRVKNDREKAEEKAQARIERVKQQFARVEGAMQQMQTMNVGALMPASAGG
jgi:flagellar hook-associated protein 2